MTTRIKLRRDTSSNWSANNPVLALGEPGLEIDTGRIKYGDGTTAWNTLSYAAGGGGGLKSRWVGLYNTCGNGQFVTSSQDGFSWTAEHVIELADDQAEVYTYAMAIGANKIVYLNTIGPYGWVTYANSPDEPVTDPLTQDITSYGPNGEAIYWLGIEYLNGYFIIYGTYDDTTYTTHGNYPAFAYSADGLTWHRGTIDQAYIASLVAAEQTGGDSNASGMTISGVAANSTGFLFGLQWFYASGSPISPANAGAFFITSLSTQLSSAYYRNLAPIAGTSGEGPFIDSAVHNDGIGWVMTDYDSAIYINTTTDASGSWTTIDVNASEAAAFGNSVDGTIYDITAGTINGQHLLFVAYSNGRVMITGDRGSTWHGVVPFPDVATIYTVTASTTGSISFETGNWDSARVTITGASVSAMNGTFYLGSASGGNYPVFSDGGLTTPVDTTTWTNNHVTVTISSCNFGSNIVYVVDATGLLPGMCSGEFTWPSNTIVSINGNALTMKYPVYDTTTNDTGVLFTPQATFSYGQGIYGIFLSPTSVLALGSSNNIGITTADPTQQNSWLWNNGVNIGYNDQENNSHSEAWLTTFAYGSYISIPTSWEYTPNANEPGVTNTMTLAESFQVSVTEVGNFYEPNTVSLAMDPTISGWKLSALAYNGYDLGSISSYFDDSVQMSIGGYRLALNSEDGSIVSDYDGNNQGKIIFNQNGGVAISGTNNSTLYNILSLNYHDNYSYMPNIAIGPKAGPNPTDGNTIAIGYEAGQTSQAGHAIAIGARAGKTGQGDSAIAIGASASGAAGGGGSAQSANSIIINAQGYNTPLFDAGANTLVIKPIRNNVGPTSLYYDSTSGEITYGTTPSGSGASLPSNAAGFLYNDGSGTLGWINNVVSSGSTGATWSPDGSTNSVTIESFRFWIDSSSGNLFVSSPVSPHYVSWSGFTNIGGTISGFRQDTMLLTTGTAFASSGHSLANIGDTYEVTLLDNTDSRVYKIMAYTLAIGGTNNGSGFIRVERIF
jgi:hypothetical protein